MRVRNYTPHPIRVLAPVGVSYDPKTRKFILTGDPVVIAEFPSEGVLSAHFTDVDSGNVDGVPLVRRAVLSADPMPTGDDYIIVSTVYAMAAKAASPTLKSVMNINRLLTVGDTVYQDGKPVGCLSLVRA